jgi:hypothetical protein
MYGMNQNHAHVLISLSCLAYLWQFETLDCLDRYTIQQYPLADYAARYWVEHVWFDEDPSSDKLLASIVGLFQSSPAQSVSCILLSMKIPSRRCIAYATVCKLGAVLRHR